MCGFNFTLSSSNFNISFGLLQLGITIIASLDDALYPEVGRFYGGGANYKAIWNQMKTVNQNAKALKEALDRGEDPIGVTFAAAQEKPKAQGNDTAARMFLFLM